MRRGREGVHDRGLGVVGEDAVQGVQEHRLPVAAGAVDEEERVLAGVAGQAVAGDLLQEAHEAGIRLRRVLEEAQPGRALGGGGRRDSGEPGDVVAALGGAQTAGAQVDGAAGRAEGEVVRDPRCRR